MQHRETKLCLVPLDESVRNDCAVGLGDCSGGKHALQFTVSTSTTGWWILVYDKHTFEEVGTRTTSVKPPSTKRFNSSLS